jgi:hypothetical protein
LSSNGCMHFHIHGYTFHSLWKKNSVFHSLVPRDVVIQPWEYPDKGLSSDILFRMITIVIVKKTPIGFGLTIPLPFSLPPITLINEAVCSIGGRFSVQGEWLVLVKPIVLFNRGLPFKIYKSLIMFVRGPDGAQNLELLCWRDQQRFNGWTDVTQRLYPTKKLHCDTSQKPKMSLRNFQMWDSQDGDYEACCVSWMWRRVVWYNFNNVLGRSYCLVLFSASHDQDWDSERMFSI